MDDFHLVSEFAEFAVKLVILLSDARFVVVVGDDGYFHALFDTAAT